MDLLPLQERLSPALPTILGCKDYRERERLLERVDRILRASGLERLFLALSMGRWEAAGGACAGVRAAEAHQRRSLRALRCTVLGKLLGLSFRELSAHLAESALCRRFCGLEGLDVVKVPGKSELQRFRGWLPQEDMVRVLDALGAALCREDAARLIGLECELDAETAWADSTCLKANIHVPTDWVLLRDGARTIIKSVLVIRRHGLAHRIGDPGDLLARMNRLCMGMSAAGRKPGSKKERKVWLRAMKKLSKVIEGHGRRYRELLDEHWAQSDLTRKEAEVILRRLDGVLDKLPEARRQAHERIIGGRQVPNADKILSLYEGDVHVVVRGKASAEVEFGNTLFVVETAEGFILDHELCREQSPGDGKWLAGRFAAIKERSGGRLCGVAADRGFDGPKVREVLKGAGAFNGVCPKSPQELGRRIKEEAFAGAQRRRAQTEGRIGILNNVFLGGTPRSKGFESRQMEVAWAVLAHNLWVAARLPWAEDAEEEEARAA